MSSAERILSFLDDGAATCAEIVHVTGLSKRTVRFYLAEMSRDGRVTKSGKLLLPLDKPGAPPILWRQTGAKV